MTPSRGAAHEVQRGCSGLQPRAHVLAAIHGVRAPNQHEIDNREADFLLCSGEPSFQDIPWAQLDALLARYMDVLFWRGEVAHVASSALAAVHDYFPTFPKARHGGLPSARAERAGSEKNRTGHFSLLPKPVFAMIGLFVRKNNWDMATALALAWHAMLRLSSDLVWP